jgi:lipopolysaccharide export system protein LptA
MSKIWRRAIGASAAGVLLAAPAIAQQTRILPGANSRAPISINADKLDYFDKDQKLIYTGGVIARQGDSTLKASALTILLSGAPAAPGEQSGGGPSNSQVKRMEAEGPVTIVQKDQVGQGDRGVYDKAENKVYLYGNVSLTQGTNVIKGAPSARLVYDLTSGRAQIVGGVSSLFTPGSDEPGRKRTTPPRGGN